MNNNEEKIKLQIRLLEIEKEELESDGLTDWGWERLGEITQEIDVLQNKLGLKI